MTTTTVNNPGQGNLKGKLGTWLMILATAALAFVMFVEFVNILEVPVPITVVDDRPCSILADCLHGSQFIVVRGVQVHLIVVVR